MTANSPKMRLQPLGFLLALAALNACVVAAEAVAAPQPPPPPAGPADLRLPRNARCHVHGRRQRECIDHADAPSTLASPPVFQVADSGG